MFKVEWFIWDSLAGRLISTETASQKELYAPKRGSQPEKPVWRRAAPARRPARLRMPPLVRIIATMALFRTSRRVEFCDTDMAGIAHFANFFRWMESAEVEFLRTRGLSVKMDWEGQAIGFPRVGASCDYVSPARFQDLIDIELSIERLGDKSVTYAFEFFCGGKKLAAGKVTSVCCRVLADNRFEATAIPAGYRARLEQPHPCNP
jgi:acyl-CoA thioester hydrolase